MSKIKDIWKLPLPEDHGDEWEWKPIVKFSRMIPWGYKESEEDPDILIPIPEELALYELAKEHLKKYSYRDVAAWLSEASGKSISHVGLYDRVKNEQRRKKKISQYEYFARKYREAAAKAQKLKERNVGFRGPKAKR